MSRPIDLLVGAGWREQYVGANGVRQHLWRTGGDGAVVVALPGFQEIGLTWARVAKRLEADFEIIMVDFRGQGRTERGTAAYTQAVLVDDVAALLGALGIAHASVIGFSNGAGVAAELAATHASLVDCVVLEDPPRNTGRMPSLADSPQYQAWHTRWLEWLEQFQSLSPDAQLAAISSQIPGGGSGWSHDELVAFTESYAQLDLEFVRDAAALWKVANRSAAKLLAEIRCPTLLIEATQGMPGGPPPAAPSDESAIPAHVKRVAFDTGHFVRREQFERYMAVVEPFLREHAGSRARRG